MDYSAYVTLVVILNVAVIPSLVVYRAYRLDVREPGRFEWIKFSLGVLVLGGCMFLSTMLWRPIGPKEVSTGDDPLQGAELEFGVWGGAFLTMLIAITAGIIGVARVEIRKREIRRYRSQAME